MLPYLIIFCNLLSQLFSLVGNENKKVEEINLEVLTLVNEVRAKGCMCGNDFYPPAKLLQYNYTLQKAAQNLSMDMELLNYFNHLDSKGLNVAQRLNKEGYNWLACAENIAKNQESAEDVVQAWLKSTKHCKNIMNPDFDEMGVAKVGPYWTQVLAIK